MAGPDYWCHMALCRTAWRTGVGTRIRDRRNNRIGVGDLVEYQFKNWDGYETKVGLITYIDSRAAWQGTEVIKVLGLDGEMYTIHPEYLEKIEEHNE